MNYTGFDLRTLKKQVKQVQQTLENTQGKPRKLSLSGKVAWVSRASKIPQPKPPGKPEAPNLDALGLQAKTVCWAALHEHKEALNLLLDRGCDPFSKDGTDLAVFAAAKANKWGSVKILCRVPAICRKMDFIIW